MESSVDTLVYQMEDDDPSIKYDAIRKLREIAAQLPRQSTPPPPFPVRNARRFLNCVRRRLHDMDNRVVVEALLLVCDLIPVLGTDNRLHLGQIVLPPLLTMLPLDEDWTDDVAFPHTALHVLWVYSLDSKDLRPVMDILINQGLNHDDGAVRESSILAIKHLMTLNAKATHPCGLDYGMLVEVLIPSMEDDEESTVVAAEETLGWMQGHVGKDGFAKLTQRLNGRDKAILVEHKPFIAKFMPEGGGSDDHRSDKQLQFDVVPKWIVDVLTSPAASVADKQSAMDNLVSVVLHASILACQWPALLAFLLSLCVHVDHPSIVHPVLECIRHIVQAVQRLVATVEIFPALVELFADMPHDDMLMDLLQLMFQLDQGVCLKLLPTYQHHSSRVREHACLVLIMFVLRHPTEPLPVSSMVLHIGRLLCDPSVRVRQVAMEVCAVLKHVCNLDMLALLRTNQDVYADAIDWQLLQRRLQQAFVPILTSRGSVCLDPTAPVLTSSSRSEPDSNRSNRSRNWVPKDKEEGAASPSVVSSSESAKQPSAQDIAKNLTTLKLRSLQKKSGKAADVARYATSTPVEAGAYLSTGEREHHLRLPQGGSSTTHMHNDHQSMIKPTPYFNLPRPVVDNPSESLSSPRHESNPPPPKTMLTGDDRPIKPMGRQQPHQDNEGAAPTPSRFLDDDHDSSDQGMYYYSPRATTTTTTKRHLKPSSSSNDRPIKVQHSVEETVAKPSRVPVKRNVRPLNSKAPAVSSSTAPRTPSAQDADSLPPENPLANDRPVAPPRAMTLATRKRIEAKQDKDAANAAVAATDAAASSSGGGGWLKSGDELRMALRAGKQEYVPTASLMDYPLPGSTKSELAKCVKLMHATDWESNFEGLTALRQIAVHAPDAVAGQLAPLVVEVVKQINNLRSSIAKNAMLAIETLCVSLSRKMDAEMDTVMPLLLKRAADTNAFLSEAAASTLVAVVQSCSAAKLLASLLPHAVSKHALIRKQVATVMGTILIAEAAASRLESYRELDRVLSTLCSLVGDSNNEVRDTAKPTLLFLKTQKYIDPARLKRAVPSATLMRVEQVLQTSSIADQPDKQPRQAKPPKPPQVVDVRDGNIQDELASMLVALESSNWKDRYDALETCKPFVHQHAAVLCQSGKLNVLFDTLNKRLDDGNAKVSLCALETLVDIIPPLGNGLDAVLANLVPTLTRNLAANNQKVALLADKALDLLCKHVDGKLLCPPFVVAGRGANTRTKPGLIEKITRLAIMGAPSTTLTRHVLPMAFDLMKESKTDIRDANQGLLRALYATMGPAMLDSAYKLPKTHQDKLGQVLGVRL
ncbi:hypothetical protein H257_12910 [Aphanomyces astaci]|uniref:TOG domain-containing protein n=1 Tax=Aphanomyces astaci TaxID=112090 RepID=W4FZF3_APHAT|nr:hypothetical protein H257_12910 [Aphanomyces astaci]ETV72149.1 hypothetical protein H257_12910 [Aphanomyces astaci]|eukprot:XP_009838592.1 hypothetical protein H257_12910 [Aphanomyces astaci]